ncbi:MAG: ornithine cyclodeaminase family protein [Solirubrobacterales bacterium]|nr:ornithine cyclodeaminase family protein [Solirubrobacterales bacterium]
MASVLVLGRGEVTDALPIGECIEAIADVLAAQARAEVHQPLRSVTTPPSSEGFMGLMPAHRGGERPLFALKAVCIFPGNPARGLDAHQGTVTLFDGATGEPTAILDASALTAIRTAAVSALATRLLAADDARELAILGAGVQAAAHLEALLAVRNFDRVRVYSPTREHAERLAREAGDRARVEVCDDAERAVRGAQVVVTVTTSREPVLRREWLAEGAHLNAVGASSPSSRELDTATVAACSLFVDSRESVLNEAGEYRLAVSEGAIEGPGHIRAELGEVVAGLHAGRTGPDELTVFRSLGLAIEDLAAAEHAVESARRAGAGVEVEL